MRIDRFAVSKASECCAQIKLTRNAEWMQRTEAEIHICRSTVPYQLTQRYTHSFGHRGASTCWRSYHLTYIKYTCIRIEIYKYYDFDIKFDFHLSHMCTRRYTHNNALQLHALNCSQIQLFLRSSLLCLYSCFHTYECTHARTHKRIHEIRRAFVYSLEMKCAHVNEWIHVCVFFSFRSRQTNMQIR